MRVFVTGASGWIGSAVVPELIGAGHQVVGLARSDASAAALAAAGAEVAARHARRPRRPARAPRPTSDGVIHLAFKHELAFSGDFAGRGRRRPPRHRGVRRRARGLRPTVRHRLRDCSASRRAGWRPSRTGTAPTRRPPLAPARDAGRPTPS